MKKGINLKIKDYRDSFNEPHKKKPYYLFIEYGSQTFVFSNKKLAERWLVKFKKESTELYKELGTYILKLYELNIKLVSQLNFVSFKKNIAILDYCLERYSKVLNGNSVYEIQIGREINSTYYQIENQIFLLKKNLQKNNRNNSLLIETNVQIKLLKRLRFQFDLLLSDTSGIKKIETSEKIEFLHTLRIA
jgi:hypothetical protein